MREELSPGQREQLAERLKALGFELLDSMRQRQIERIKSLIIRQTQRLDGEKIAISELISKDLNREYSQLSKLFSEHEERLAKRHDKMNEVFDDIWFF